MYASFSLLSSFAEGFILKFLTEIEDFLIFSVFASYILILSNVQTFKIITYPW